MAAHTVHQGLQPRPVIGPGNRVIVQDATAAPLDDVKPISREGAYNMDRAERIKGQSVAIDLAGARDDDRTADVPVAQ